MTAAGHAIEAAGALERVLKCDPDLNLVPHFLGTFLIQGSLFFLYFAEKLPREATEDIAAGCETYLRALSTRSFAMNAKLQVCAHIGHSTPFLI